MTTITLKLTDNEIMFIHMEMEIEKLNKGFEEEYVFLNGYSAKRIGIDLSDNEYLIQDVDKFREFLNDEIAELNRGHSLNVRKYDNLKSILSKLDDAVKEPKCTKCGSLFEDEIFKTDGCEYEDYICSNNKCCAVHTINIQRNEGDWDKEIGEVDIERDWDTLDFEYIWKEGLKKDEPKSDFKKIYCEVCGEGHKSEDIGLVFGLNTCVSCADNIGEELQDRGHNSL